MAYLTLDEYKELGNYRDISQDEFRSLETKAETLLDVITDSYYQFNDITKDNEWRVKRVKQALVSQIDYFKETGKTTNEGLNSVPQSVSLGRTSISQGSRYNASGSNESKSLVCDEMFMFLEGTGLLYRGVCSW